MKTFSLFIYTKNSKSLKSFLRFFANQLRKNDTVFLTKMFFLKKNKKLFTILKSPHVNKIAQEQFEIKTIILQIDITVINIYKCLIFLKKINNTLFADIIFKLKFFHNIQKQSSFIKTVFKYDKLKFNTFCLNNSLKKIKKVKLFQLIQRFNKTPKIHFHKQSLNLSKYTEISGLSLSSSVG